MDQLGQEHSCIATCRAPTSQPMALHARDLLATCRAPRTWPITLHALCMSATLANMHRSSSTIYMEFGIGLERLQD
ncbi:hypothetical protein HanRHA438_Chr07g0294731 [Helianthus annuus]|nr:hypothetical protein HanRHA438_Chr07g0294731 [Helianthus annuus]